MCFVSYSYFVTNNHIPSPVQGQVQGQALALNTGITTSVQVPHVSTTTGSSAAAISASLNKMFVRKAGTGTSTTPSEELKAMNPLNPHYRMAGAAMKQKVPTLGTMTLSGSTTGVASLPLKTTGLEEDLEGGYGNDTEIFSSS